MVTFSSSWLTRTDTASRQSGMLVGLLSLLGLACVATASREVVTNQFHVLVKREASQPGSERAMADDIARQNGFHNLGPVSSWFTL